MSQEDLQELERVAVAARDALTDDMVTRLSSAAADGLDVLDRVNRSGIAAALPALAELVRNGDLERLVALARNYGAAQDAMTDDMVSRLTDTVSGGLDLLDRANRAELGRAIPILARLIASGDLERITHLARVVGAAEDAVTDEMVSRVTDTVSGGLDLLDRANRAELGRAIPILARLIASGDLERVTHLARVVGAAEDALTDEMIGRLTEAVAGALSIADRMNRAGADRLIGALERLAAGGGLERLEPSLERLGSSFELLERMVAAVDEAAGEVRSSPRGGGVGGMWRLLGDAENQATLRFLLGVGRRLRAKGS